MTSASSAPAQQACAGNGVADGSCGAELGWGLTALVRAFGQWAASSVADLPGGPRGHLVLATVSRGLPSSQLALARDLGLDRTVMTYLLDELEDAGLVERRPDPADRRARQVLITDAGTQALREFGARLTEAENKLLAPLTPSEAVDFRSMVERVARAARAGDAGNSACTAQDVTQSCPEA